MQFTQNPVQPLHIYLFLFYLPIYLILTIYKYNIQFINLENTIAYHIANLRQRTKYIIHTSIQTITDE